MEETLALCQLIRIGTEESCDNSEKIPGPKLEPDVCVKSFIGIPHRLVIEFYIITN
jgi:hypothetical protein